jgi:hypothetical protein
MEQQLFGFRSIRALRIGLELLATSIALARKV